jgi:hypothetical protein
MVAHVKALWAGDLPLARVFWDYAIIYGLLLNLATHGVFLALLMQHADPVLVAIAFAFPVPYNAFVVVAVWRSAGRYPGSQNWADWARISTVVWMLALTLA